MQHRDTAQTAEISVIVVNYGTPDLAIAAVDSVLTRDHGGRVVDVHLVDNASPGGDAERFRAMLADPAWDGRVTLYAEAVNHGFGGGNNVALRALAARLRSPAKVMLLNPDARLSGDALAVLAGTLDADPGLGFAGAAVAMPDGTNRCAAFRFPNPLGEFEEAASFGPLARALAPWRIALPPDTPTGPVDWVTGAAVMARFRALAELGFFDPGYFLYYEEVDLMRRGARAGWRCRHVAEARVIHAEGAATGVESAAAPARRPAYWYASWRRYFLRNHGRAVAVLAGLARVLGTALNAGLARMRHRPAAAAPGTATDWLAATRAALTGPVCD